jgi:uncharacterized protein
MAIKIRCPRCGQSTVFGPTNPARPFCSERCRLGDLGAWAKEEYVIAGADDAPSPDLIDVEPTLNRKN